MDTETKPLWTTTREAMGKTWTVGLCADDTALIHGGSKLGKGHTFEQYLNINANMPAESRDETLLHELLHITSNLVEGSLEEAQVVRLSSTLYAFLRGFGLWQPFPWPDKKK